MKKDRTILKIPGWEVFLYFDTRPNGRFAVKHLSCEEPAVWKGVSYHNQAIKYNCCYCCRETFPSKIKTLLNLSL